MTFGGNVIRRELLRRCMGPWCVHDREAASAFVQCATKNRFDTGEGGHGCQVTLLHIRDRM